MEDQKFSYTGKFMEELFLLLLGIGLSIFMVYELFLTDDILILRAVEMPALLSKITMVIFIIASIALTIVSFGNLINRNNKFIEVTSTHIVIPKIFSKTPTVMDLSSIEDVERQDYNGIEMILFKVRDRLTRIGLESSKFQSTSEYSRFLKYLKKVLG